MGNRKSRVEEMIDTQIKIQQTYLFLEIWSMCYYGLFAFRQNLSETNRGRKAWRFMCWHVGLGIFSIFYFDINKPFLFGESIPIWSVCSLILVPVVGGVMSFIEGLWCGYRADQIEEELRRKNPF